MGFGLGPLSQPFLVEAIESEFVPVLIYNNREGRDAELCKRFNEPAWNNPVVRFLSGSGADVLARKDQVWATKDLVQRMTAALRAAGRDSPDYLERLEAELAPTQPMRAVFAMYCFWEGEAKLGGIEGVLSTRPGQFEQEEVVEVTYDAARVDFAVLVAAALELQCAGRVYCSDDSQLAIARAKVGEKAVKRVDRPTNTPASDRKHALRATPWWHVPMTPLQQARVNADLALGRDPERWLTPRQRQWARAIIADPSAAQALRELTPSEDLETLRTYVDAFLGDLPSSAR